MIKASKKLRKSNSNSNAKINLNSQWKELEPCLKNLVAFLKEREEGVKKPFDNTSYMKYYTIVYNSCTVKVEESGSAPKASKFFYEKFGQSITTYLKDVVQEIKGSNENILVLSVKRWKDHLIIVKYMRKIFSYLDKFYTEHNHIEKLDKLGLKKFYEQVYSFIKDRLRNEILQKIENERNGEEIDRGQLNVAVELFKEMGLGNLIVYEKDFEKYLLDVTRLYYEKEAQNWIVKYSCPEYLKKAEKRINEEKDRSGAYLESKTTEPLLEVVRKEIIYKYADKLLHKEKSGFVSMLNEIENRKNDMQRMFELFESVDKLEDMAKEFREFIKMEGENIVLRHGMEEEIDYVSFIESILNMDTKYTQLVVNQFHHDPLFTDAMKDAFTNFVNKDIKHGNSKSTTAELLSRYCNHIMKKDDMSEEEANERLVSIVHVFSYLSDKDMFQEYYRRMLSRRLLMESSNEFLEQNLISKLKQTAGASFTSKIEGMVKDKNLSARLAEDFKQSEWCKSIETISFTPTVLTLSFWPPFKVSNIVLPPTMNSCLDAFKKFYDSRTEARSLKWVHGIGTTTLYGRYKYGDKDMSMTTYQTCIMLLYNTKNVYTATEISDALGLTIGELKSSLLTLCAYKKMRLLIKSTSTSVISNDDEFKLNEDFKSKSSRVKLKNTQSTISSEERKKIEESTELERQSVIEAAIVRIMKSHKKLGHQELTTNVMKQLLNHFKPQPRTIKRRIEELINRGYLERDANQSSIYHYVS